MHCELISTILVIVKTMVCGAEPASEPVFHPIFGLCVIFESVGELLDEGGFRIDD